MANNQALFLDRIRIALKQGSRPSMSVATDDKAFLQSIASRGREEQLLLLRQLTDNAEPLHLQVHGCASLTAAGECVAAIARECKPEFGTSREIVLHDHPLMHGLQLAPLLSAQGIANHLTRSGDPDVRQHTVNASIGITVAAWAIAESATIVQLTRPGQPRSTSLVPSIHIAVMLLSNLVATLAEAYALLRREQHPDSLVLISGPSKTADIEHTMVHGAHGPREMHLIVLTGAMVEGETA